MSWIIHPVEGDLNFHSEEKRVLLNKINPSTAGLPYPQKKKSVMWKRGRGETATDTEMTTGDEVGGGSVRSSGSRRVERGIGKDKRVDRRVLGPVWDRLFQGCFCRNPDSLDRGYGENLL
jgi:hypothetical protein